MFWCINLISMKMNINFVYESMTNTIFMKRGSHAIPLTCAYNNDYEHEVHIEFYLCPRPHNRCVVAKRIASFAVSYYSYIYMRQHFASTFLVMTLYAHTCTYTCMHTHTCTATDLYSWPYPGSSIGLQSLGPSVACMHIMHTHMHTVLHIVLYY